MEVGAITNHIDVAQVVTYLFWIFFAGLVLYLQREGKREGYPLIDDGSSDRPMGYWPLPSPKTFVLPHGGGEVTVPNPAEVDREVALEMTQNLRGSTWEPTGDPLADGVGPAAWATRMDVPDVTFENHARIVPLRACSDEFALETRDTDPRGMDVLANDMKVAGQITDVWVDRSEQVIRYLECQTPSGRTVLVPMNLALISPSEGGVRVRSLLAAQFEGVPGTKDETTITRLEEDKILAYFAGGKFYQTDRSMEPLL